jgi:hypothetical protein
MPARLLIPHRPHGTCDPVFCSHRISPPPASHQSCASIAPVLCPHRISPERPKDTRDGVRLSDAA